MLATEETIREARQQAAHLLNEVLEERLVPQLAINRWPAYDHLQDVSLKIAYQALWHFEADEAQQRTEMFYMDAQLELLRQMAVYLGQGRPLPGYMLKLYPKERCVHFFRDLPFADDLELEVRRYWHGIKRLWDQAFSLLPVSTGRIRNRQKPL